MCKTKLESRLNNAVTDLLTHFTWSVKVHCRYPKLLLMGPAAAAHWRVNVCVRRWMKSLCKTLWVTLRCRKVHSLSVEIWMAQLITVYELAMTQHVVLLPWTRSDLKSLNILKICCHGVCDLSLSGPVANLFQKQTSQKKKRQEDNNVIRKWLFCQ